MTTNNTNRAKIVSPPESNGPTGSKTEQVAPRSDLNNEKSRLSRCLYPLPAFSLGVDPLSETERCTFSADTPKGSPAIAPADPNAAILDTRGHERLEDLLFEVEPNARLSHQAEKACTTFR